MDAGCGYFISQAVYSVEATKKDIRVRVKLSRPTFPRWI
jgi:hypothetical protein